MRVLVRFGHAFRVGVLMIGLATRVSVRRCYSPAFLSGPVPMIVRMLVMAMGVRVLVSMHEVPVTVPVRVSVRVRMLMRFVRSHSIILITRFPLRHVRRKGPLVSVQPTPAGLDFQPTLGANPSASPMKRVEPRGLAHNPPAAQIPAGQPPSRIAR